MKVGLDLSGDRSPPQSWVDFLAGDRFSQTVLGLTNSYNDLIEVIMDSTAGYNIMVLGGMDELTKVGVLLPTPTEQIG